MGFKIVLIHGNIMDCVHSDSWDQQINFWKYIFSEFSSQEILKLIPEIKSAPEKKIHPYLNIAHKQTLKEWFTASSFIDWCVNAAAASAGARQPPSHVSPKPVVFFLTFPMIKNISGNQNLRGEFSPASICFILISAQKKLFFLHHDPEEIQTYTDTLWYRHLCFMNELEQQCFCYKECVWYIS